MASNRKDLETEIVKKLQDENTPLNEKEEILREIVENYKNSLLNLVYNYIKPKGILQDAEEIVAQTFIKFYKTIKSFKQKSSIKTYLFRIAINLSVNFLKSKKESFIPIEELEKEPIKYQSEEEKIIYDEEKKYLQNALKEALDNLSKKQKLAFYLVNYQQMSYKEVAEVMKISVSAVESLIFRAKQNIKKYILRNKELKDKFEKL
ncbi:MAG: RNA polymerase sigma factor [Elusimicrobiota bacterium]|nr:RNA polymerase sigma factor [Endomicrobiia bacterium]MDW8165460.1 RNA polymerase sigma factor [Elusimicrobiota bacterium]